MVGLLDRADRAVPSFATTSGDAILILGATRDELGASALWEVCSDFRGGQPPRVDLDAEKALVEFLVTAANRGVLHSAHDCSQGGLGVALAEIAMGGPYQASGFGLEVNLTGYGTLNALTLLFSESHGRAVVTCPLDRQREAQTLARECGVPVYFAGLVGRPDGEVRVTVGRESLAAHVGALREVYFGAIPAIMGD
jgi:phosphoribosylformylglycinamidine synthase